MPGSLVISREENKTTWQTCINQSAPTVTFPVRVFIMGLARGAELSPLSLWKENASWFSLLEPNLSHPSPEVNTTTTTCKNFAWLKKLGTKRFSNSNVEKQETNFKTMIFRLYIIFNFFFNRTKRSVPLYCTYIVKYITGYTYLHNSKYRSKNKVNLTNIWKLRYIWNG